MEFVEENVIELPCDVLAECSITRKDCHEFSCELTHGKCVYVVPSRGNHPLLTQLIDVIHRDLFLDAIIAKQTVQLLFHAFRCVHVKRGY